MSSRLIIGGAVISLLVASHSFAQTQAQFDQINEVAQRGVAIGACDRFGYVVAPDAGDGLTADLTKEMVTSGLSEAESSRLIAQAVQRNLSRFQTDLDSRLAEAKGATDLGPKTVGMLTDLAQMCHRAASDTIVGKYLSEPAGYDLGATVTKLADAMLVDGGLASWQTAQIRNRGDLVSVAGACRRTIGATRSDALFAMYSRTEDPRERDYYARSFQRGIDDPELTALDSVQCERVISSFTKKAGPPPK